MRTRRPRSAPVSRSTFAGFRFPPTERGIEVDHVSIYRRVQRFTPQLADAARP